MCFLPVFAPPVKFPNVYGIDMPARSELIAYGHTVDEVRQIIGADRLIFQDLDDLIEAVSDTKYSHVKQFDCSVFDGNYVAGGIDENYLNALQQKRSDMAKQQKQGVQLIADTPVDIVGIDPEV